MSDSTPSAGWQKVLLIDDDDLIAGCLRQYLAQQGYDVDVALEPCEAAALMRARPYDVIVVDPYLTGGVCTNQQSALLESICLLQPEASVIVVTGYGSSLLTQTAQAGRMSLLTKPLSVVALSDFISKGLSI